jgi:hypothetical protein
LSLELKIKIAPLIILDGQFKKEVAHERNNPGVLDYLQRKIVEECVRQFFK